MSILGPRGHRPIGIQDDAGFWATEYNAGFPMDFFVSELALKPCGLFVYGPCEKARTSSSPVFASAAGKEEESKTLAWRVGVEARLLVTTSSFSAAREIPGFRSLPL